MNSILIKEDYNHETYVYCDKGSDSFFYNSLNYSLTKSFKLIFLAMKMSQNIKRKKSKVVNNRREAVLG